MSYLRIYRPERHFANIFDINTNYDNLTKKFFPSQKLLKVKHWILIFIVPFLASLISCQETNKQYIYPQGCYATNEVNEVIIIPFSTPNKKIILRKAELNSSKIDSLNISVKMIRDIKTYSFGETREYKNGLKNDITGVDAFTTSENSLGKLPIVFIVIGLFFFFFINTRRI